MPRAWAAGHGNSRRTATLVARPLRHDSAAVPSPLDWWVGRLVENEKMTMNAKELGAQLARDLMELGGERRPCHRIEFKGGNWPDGEIPQGGMNEGALARFFALRLAVLMRHNV